MSDNLLDSTLDDLADLPVSAPYPAGCHAATMFLEAPKPKPGKKQIITAKFKYKDNKEMADPSAVPPNAGDEAIIFINLYKKDGEPNEFGQGQLKQLLEPLQAGGLTGSNRELIEATKPGVDVIIVTGVRDYNGQPQMTLIKIELEG